MASFAPPIAFCTLPAVLSALPSACSLASPVTLPAASFTAPLAWLAAPSIRSLSMVLPFVESHGQNASACQWVPPRGGQIRYGRIPNAASFAIASTWLRDDADVGLGLLPSFRVNRLRFVV